jgi:transcriptional regulator with GAF, ATPase, and Fis domain
VSRDQLHSLKQLAGELQRQLESFKPPLTPAADGNLDFYIEVQQFEVALIKQALRAAGGHQKKAAELLNLNGTTLNAMIKRYRIKVDSLLD